MHPCCAVARRRSANAHIMEWPTADDWPLAAQSTCSCACEDHKQRPAPKPPDPVGPAHAQPYTNSGLPYPVYYTSAMDPPPPTGNVPTFKGETPRDLRNKAEKQRRDKLSQSIHELSKIVPPVLAMNRKVDKTSVLRLTAHYLRSHQYVFGDSLDSPSEFEASSVEALMSFLNGFIITTTYKGLVVVISPNVEKYLGYTELELIGRNILNIIHEEDQKMMLEQIMPKSFLVGSNDEILFPEDPDAKLKVAETLANERRSFSVRFKMYGERSAPIKYINCHIQGSFRKSDKACRSNNRHFKMVRHLRARGRNWRTSGNDVVFIGLVRPTYDTFVTESKLDSCLMEYRTRHSIDGEIISCDSRISLATGYMANEVKGVNAMNFMHRDDVRWVIVALREMYDQHRLSGESCYRLMTKCGKFVYMRTKGYLEVDKNTGAVTSFVCINRVVDKEEGRQLNMEMKKKFQMLVHNTDEPPPEDDDEEVNDTCLPVEDPRQLQKVILHLVTNLPSPSPDTTQSNSPFQEERSPYRLSIIPPKKERIVHAIDKIYNVIQCFRYSPRPITYKKQKIFKRLQSDEIHEIMTSNREKPKKSKRSDESRSRSNSPTSFMEHSQPVEYMSQDIEPYDFYPDLISGTSTVTSPQAGLPGLQRYIDPLILRRLYQTEPEYNAVDHNAQVSSTIEDSTKTYAVMIPSIVTGEFGNNLSTSEDDDRYLQLLCPTPDVDINEPETKVTSTPLQYYSNLAPSGSNMGETINSAPTDPSSTSHMQNTSLFPSVSEQSTDNRQVASNVRPLSPPIYNPEYGKPQNWQTHAYQEVQPGPSRPPLLPTQNYSTRPIPITNYPVSLPHIQNYPLTPSHIQNYPVQPLFEPSNPVPTTQIPNYPLPPAHVSNYTLPPSHIPHYPVSSSFIPNYAMPNYAVQPPPVLNYPAHSPMANYTVAPSPMQNYAISASPIVNYRLPSSPMSNYPVGPSSTQNYAVPPLPIVNYPSPMANYSVVPSPMYHVPSSPMPNYPEVPSPMSNYHVPTPHMQNYSITWPSYYHSIPPSPVPNYPIPPSPNSDYFFSPSPNPNYLIHSLPNPSYLTQPSPNVNYTTSSSYYQETPMQPIPPMQYSLDHTGQQGFPTDMPQYQFEPEREVRRHSVTTETVTAPTESQPDTTAAPVNVEEDNVDAENIDEENLPLTMTFENLIEFVQAYDLSMDPTAGDDNGDIDELIQTHLPLHIPPDEPMEQQEQPMPENPPAEPSAEEVDVPIQNLSIDMPSTSDGRTGHQRGA